MCRRDMEIARNSDDSSETSIGYPTDRGVDQDLDILLSPHHFHCVSVLYDVLCLPGGIDYKVIYVMISKNPPIITRM